MELTGKVIAVLDTQSGTSSRGNSWEKKEFVIETQEQYPKKACFTLFNKTELCPKVGEEVTVYFNITANEHNGKWYNSVNAWKVEKPQPAQPAPEPTQTSTQQPTKASDDLPF